MQAVKVTVTRKGTVVNSDEDAKRLDMELTATNYYKNSYDAVMISIQDAGYCWCVRESDLKLVQARMNEITVRELPVVVQEVV